MSLHIGGFGGGVAILGAADTRKIDEVAIADSLDIGARGALVMATERAAYLTLNDGGTVPAAWTQLLALIAAAGFDYSRVLAIGAGTFNVPPDTAVLLVNSFQRTGEASPLAFTKGNMFVTAGDLPFAPPAPGLVVTGAAFPGRFLIGNGVVGGFPANLTLVCLGAREGFAPNTAPGLHVVFFHAGSAGADQVIAYPIGFLDALGTGADGSYNVATGGPGSKATHLYPRGVVLYNDYAFVWGFDSADPTYGDGPNRVMFSNLGDPTKWGNDNQGAVGTDRQFTDSDAIVLGDAGEIIRGALMWAGKLWFGTNQQLHYIGGYGRDSFLTDGARPVAKSYNIVGPHALIEGPDRRLYGLSDRGLWSTADGETFAPLFLKLVDFADRSIGYWDLIWTDETRAAAALPGRTNQDLAWLVADWERMQVVIGIPWCDATAGHGYGTDTVLIKYHVLTGGFTRQVEAGVQLTSAAFLRRQGQQRAVNLLGTATAGERTIQRYGYRDLPTDVLPGAVALPVASFGPYAPFGPDGQGVLRRKYFTLAWDSAASLPIAFAVRTTVDASIIDQFTLSIRSTAPGGPAAGDLWLDTSQSDLSMGNATAGATVAARGGYLLKTWSGSAWRIVPGQGGQGNRATIPIGLTRVQGTRYTITFTTQAAAGRFEFEGLGDEPGDSTGDTT